MYNDIYYISQYLKDLGFTEDEIVDFYGIIYNSVEQSKDIESQIAYTGNRKYVEAFSLTSSVFGGDWYYYVKTEQRGFGGGGINASVYGFLPTADALKPDQFDRSIFVKYKLIL